MATYRIQHIKIYNRSDQNSQLLANFAIYVSVHNPTKSGTNPYIWNGGQLCFYHFGQVPQYSPSSITCNTPLNGRYVYVTKSNYILAICEFEVLVQQTTNVNSVNDDKNNNNNNNVNFVGQNFDVLAEVRYDLRPLHTIPEMKGDTRCIVACLEYSATLTYEDCTVVQYHQYHGTCECVQYSSLSTPYVNKQTGDGNWTVFSLDTN